MTRKSMTLTFCCIACTCIYSNLQEHVCVVCFKNTKEKINGNEFLNLNLTVKVLYMHVFSVYEHWRNLVFQKASVQ